MLQMHGWIIQISNWNGGFYYEHPTTSLSLSNAKIQTVPLKSRNHWTRHIRLSKSSLHWISKTTLEYTILEEKATKTTYLIEIAVRPHYLRKIPRKNIKIFTFNCRNWQVIWARHSNTHHHEEKNSLCFPLIRALALLCLFVMYKPEDGLI